MKKLLKTIKMICIGIASMIALFLGIIFVGNRVYVNSHPEIILEEYTYDKNVNLDRNSFFNSVKFATRNTINGIKEGVGIVAEDTKELGISAGEDMQETADTVSNNVADLWEDIKPDE